MIVICGSASKNCVRRMDVRAYWLHASQRGATSSRKACSTTTCVHMLLDASWVFGTLLHRTSGMRKQYCTPYPDSDNFQLMMVSSCSRYEVIYSCDSAQRLHELSEKWQNSIVS
jgi:hypothetical protein